MHLHALNQSQNIFPRFKGHIDIFTYAMHRIYLHMQNQIQDIIARVKLHLDICYALDNNLFAPVYFTWDMIAHARLYQGHSTSKHKRKNVKKTRFNKIFLGPEQMAALLGPSWKSRQPRMCQYCNRMFSNKFNLKQVMCSVL